MGGEGGKGEAEAEVRKRLQVFHVGFSQELGQAEQQRHEPQSCRAGVVFSRTAPIAAIQPSIKENKPSAEQCKPSPVRGRMYGCSSFPHPPPLQCNFIQLHWSVSAVCWCWAHCKGLLWHPGHGCSTRGAPLCSQLSGAGQDFITPGHCTGNSTIPSITEAAAEVDS